MSCLVTTTETVSNKEQLNLTKAACMIQVSDETSQRSWYIQKLSCEFLPQIIFNVDRISLY